MDAIRNPYTPGAGSRSPALTGRDAEIQAFRVLVERVRQGRPGKEFAKAIEAKQIAEQSAEQMRYTLEKEQKEAERKVIEPRGGPTLAQNPNYIKGVLGERGR